MSFSLTTYNVLAQAYITPTRYPRTPGPVLASAWRRPALVRHIVALGTDVVCLQEVEDETFAAVQQALQPLGYTGHFARKGGGKPDGCATFVRQSPLTWGTVHPLMYSDGAGTERDSGHLALVRGVVRLQGPSSGPGQHPSAMGCARHTSRPPAWLSANQATAARAWPHCPEL